MFLVPIGLVVRLAAATPCDRQGQCRMMRREAGVNAPAFACQVGMCDPGHSVTQNTDRSLAISVPGAPLAHLLHVVDCVFRLLQTLCQPSPWHGSCKGKVRDHCDPDHVTRITPIPIDTGGIDLLVWGITGRSRV